MHQYIIAGVALLLSLGGITRPGSLGMISAFFNSEFRILNSELKSAPL